MGDIASVTSQNGKMAMDEAASFVNAEGFRDKNGSKFTDRTLFETLSNSEGRNILHPDKAESIINREIEKKAREHAEREEAAYYDRINEAIPEVVAGESEANRGETLAYLEGKADEEGYNPEEAYAEINSFLDDVTKAQYLEQERRVNFPHRKKVSEMTPEERAIALLTDHLTGLKNKRAYEEAQRLPFQTSIDIDGLKYINDTYGHDAGNDLLKKVGEALNRASEGELVYHLHGDEFAIETKTPEISQIIIDETKKILKAEPLEFNGEKYVADFSYGIAETTEGDKPLLDADKAMMANKTERRVERGKKTPEEIKTEDTKAGKQTTIPGASAAETFSLTPKEPATPVVKGAKLTPKNLQPKEKIGDMFAEGAEEATTKAPWQMTRDEFLNAEELDKEFRSQYVDPDGNIIASSRTTPAKQSQLKVGTWRIEKSSWNKYGDIIEQLREIEVSKIKGSEDTGRDRTDDVDRYADWIKEGKEPPLFRVAQLKDGTFKLGDGHRRLLAAKKAGLKTIKAWVALSADTGLKDANGNVIDTDLTHQLAIKQALSEGKPVPAEVLKDYPDLQKGKIVSPRDIAINKYREHMDKNSPKTAEEFTNKIVKLIDDKDGIELRRWMNGINPKINRLFTELTGLPAKTQKEADASLRSLDPEKWDNEQRRTSEEKAKRRTDKETAELNKELDIKVKFEGKTVSKRDLYDNLISKGYNEIKERKVGVATRHELHNPKTGTSIKLDKKIEADYLRDRIKSGVVEPKTESTGGKLIGKNSEGNNLYERPDGVRYFTKNNVRITEPIKMEITKEGVQPTINPDNRREQFKTVEEQPKEEVKEADLSTKSTGDLVKDMFSIINDHIGERGSISTEEVDETLYQKLKPYLAEIVKRAKAKALDARAYLFGAVDSMPEGKAKGIYETAARRYADEQDNEHYERLAARPSNKEKTAYDYGKEAFAEGKRAIPAQDAAFMEFFKALPSQDYSLKAMKDWMKGWTEANLVTSPTAREIVNANKTVSILPPKDQKKGGSYYIAKLLQSHNLLDEIMKGEDFYRKIKNPPYLDLTIERHGNELYFTHYYEQNGDLIMDGEMVWTVNNAGKLSLKETAVQDPVRGGERRAYDNTFANIFSRNLIQQGFDKAKLVNPREKEQKEEKAASPYVAVADRVVEKLRSNEKFTRNELFFMCKDAFGGTLAEGKFSAKDAYDALEMGINKYLENSPLEFPTENKDAVHVIENLKSMFDLIPTQTTRTEEMDEFQQFSTPPALAFAANWVANLKDNDVYLEPSAGTGNLAIFGRIAGVKEIIVNELAPRRAAILKELGFDKVYTENAEQINNILPQEDKPTVVVMNPPFSSTAGRMKGERKTVNATVHIEQALKRLQPGGRLVGIVGEGMAADKPAFAKWWKEIARSYQVRANIGISGKEYAKYGTVFDNQIIVIDKPLTIDNSKEKSIIQVTGKVDKIEDLINLLEGVRNERINPGEQRATQSGEQEGAPITETKTGRNGSVLPATGEILPETQPGRSGRTADNNTGRNARLETTGSNELSATRSGNRGGKGRGGLETGQQRSERTGRPDTHSDRGQPDDNAPVLSEESFQGAGLTIEQRADVEKNTELTDAVYDTYKPAKLIIPNSQEHPGKLVESAAMSSIEPIDPIYSPHLPEKAIKSGAISIAQLEAVVYAGQAHSEILPNGSRKGYFIGDGTGVGKGREIAAILWDNWNQGRHKAVWLSQNSPLMKDAQRDIAGVGWNKNLVFDIQKTKLQESIKEKEGIGFVGYGTLRTKKYTRLILWSVRIVRGP